VSGTSLETSARSGDQWTLAYHEYRPEDEGLREALCAVGNGYFVTGGACAQSSADRVHYLGTYLVGRFNRLASTIAGRVVESEDLVNLPVWLPLTFSIDVGPEFDVDSAVLLQCRQELDLRQGVLKRSLASKTTRVARPRWTQANRCRQLSSCSGVASSGVATRVRLQKYKAAKTVFY
jgi:alpha,alpha-trehalase